MINKLCLIRPVISEQPVVVGIWGCVLPPLVVRLFRTAISQTLQGVPYLSFGVVVGLGRQVVVWLGFGFTWFGGGANRGGL